MGARRCGDAAFLEPCPFAGFADSKRFDGGVTGSAQLGNVVVEPDPARHLRLGRFVRPARVKVCDRGLGNPAAGLLLLPSAPFAIATLDGIGSDQALPARGAIDSWISSRLTLPGVS